jgi:hypothetical protein
MSLYSLMHRVFPPSEPPDGGCPQSFRLVVGGNATPWELVPFSHRSASRIFIMQPGCTPRRWSPKTVTSSLMAGESKPGCGLCPSFSLKDFHHQCWGGECAELGSAPAWAVARSFPQ